jgi:hypothetical protein
MPHSATDSENGLKALESLTIASTIVAIMRSSQSKIAQADTDGRLVELWLHSRNTLTSEAYAADVADFLERVDKPIRSVTIGDLQGWVDTLVRRAGDSPAPARRGQIAADLCREDRLRPV